MESVSTPRISANMLDSYVGQNVIVVGKVMQLRGDSAVLDANGQVNAILNRESHLMAGNGAQIIGRVNPDMSVKVYNAVDLGSNVDFQVAQSVVDVTHQYKELFVYDNSSFNPQQPQTPPRPATAASYCSSSSEVYSSSSSVNNELSQLDIQYNPSPSSQPITTQGTQPSRLKLESIPQHRPTTARSYHSSSSEAFSSTSSLDHDLSQLVIQQDEPSSLPLPTTPSAHSLQPHLSGTLNRPPTARSHHSSSSEVFSSTSSLDHDLSQLVIQQDEPLFSQSITVQNAFSSQRRFPGTYSPRPGTAASYYSSSSEVSSSLSDSLDDNFSRLAVEEETPPSSQETVQSTQPSQLKSKGTQPAQHSNPSAHDTSLRQREASSQTYNSPSSTRNLTDGFSSPIQSPTVRTPRLYRTWSGSLATAEELRRRRKREEELLDAVLEGIMIIGGAEVEAPPQRSIAMGLDEAGRWRIVSICEPWGP
ncbi:replication factor A protein 3-domain-containing protein [Xylariaceae sp. AK1471]|nr:replication factor A protein 3-domain-containing protein [Xylariaceae sp. AK1471]